VERSAAQQRFLWENDFLVIANKELYVQQHALRRRHGDATCVSAEGGRAGSAAAVAIHDWGWGVDEAAACRSCDV
jgi:hypothetical protein